MLRQLALNMVRDGEGARRVGRVVVRGGDGAAVSNVARAVADSPLVKTALYGGDPNWGRIIQAVGMAMPGTAPLAVGISIEGIQVCTRGQYVPHDEEALKRRSSARRSSTRSTLPGEGAEVERYFSDLGHEYVTLTRSTPHDPSRNIPPSRRDVGTLLEALPYIREFHGKTVVIKYGGAAMIDDALKEDFARDVVLLKYVGMNPVIVHGGGPEITSYMQRLDLPVKFVDGLRVSDRETVEVAKMVLVGKVNKDIVLLINRHGQPAIGLCGDDGLLFRAKRKTAPSGQDIGFVGAIERVDVDVLTHVAQDYIPVVASVGADREGNSYNINADEAAGAVARALTAYKLMFLTDVPGWLRDPADPSSVVSEAGVDSVIEASPASRGDAAEAPGVRRRDPGRRLVRAHRRRARASFAAARAVHQRRPGHEDQAGGMSLAELAGPRARVRRPDVRPQPGASSCAARASVCGTPTATSTSTSWPGSRC